MDLNQLKQETKMSISLDELIKQTEKQLKGAEKLIVKLEEQAHLLDLQEELGLTNEEVARVEMNVRAKLNTVNN